ncbi:MAG: triphosphoribosyl-dephospho-CoA synthase [Oenococcus oeni]
MIENYLQAALKALIYEVSVFPKPGLVDPLDNSTHPDMTVFTFIDSSFSLEKYFLEVSKTAAQFRGKDLRDLFYQIRPLGIQAEKDMYAATKGVNTHKGAIFSLGIVLAASVYSKSLKTENVLTVVKKMMKGIVTRDLENKKNFQTAGEIQFEKYRLTGIRGQAEAGFPIVSCFALPFFNKRKGSLNDRLLDTLLLIARHNPDSNLIKRAGNPDVIEKVNSQIDEYFDLGGSQSQAGRKQLEKINNYFNRFNLSLGGAADMLILTIYFALIEKNI